MKCAMVSPGNRENKNKKYIKNVLKKYKIITDFKKKSASDIGF